MLRDSIQNPLDRVNTGLEFEGYKEEAWVTKKFFSLSLRSS